MENNVVSTHWADINADKIIRERKRFLGEDKECFVCASGITPSGTVHIGNFREIISVELVVRALKDKGEKVKFIYSWDNYDVFRKVPANMPNREMLEKYLRFPITSVPDPRGKEKSYARANEVELESILPEVGVFPQYIYQAEKYKNSDYAKDIRIALENSERIRKILDAHRTEPLEKKWMPVSVFCSKCTRDTTEVEAWNNEWGISYSCSSCENRETVDLRTASFVKLPWRIDWPMRWAYEKVDFEPAGKDHHSEGGSFDTAKNIAKEIYNHEPPVTFQYDFLSIKGRGGKISSSSGEVISLRDVLEVYEPEIVRYMFAGTRPNTEFAISFDLDVIKIYEDYDKCERIYFGKEVINDKKADKEKRIYELSQVGAVPSEMPCQIPFRHLCNLLQIHSGDIDALLQIEEFSKLSEAQKKKVSVRAQCAWRWITNFAPEDFRFSLKSATDPVITVDENSAKILRALALEVKKLETHTETSLAEAIYKIAQDNGADPKDIFKLVYTVLIGREKGPRLAGFIMTAGKNKILPLLERY
ncbi:MAG: lysine--tRNA ligase [Spirochaetes bacterium]|nr:lysine--tRNA ligase [Spirochaetota bacterium]